MELSSCHPAGPCDLEVAPRVLENLWARAYAVTHVMEVSALLGSQKYIFDN
jgi:hypothetical protein